MTKTRSYIAIDLETTGLNPETDAITEIAAVKFEGSTVVGTFHSLINPHRPIPYYIQQMCGIKQDEVDAAPDLSSVAPNLKLFLGVHPLVGHNVAFDIGFLAENGIRLSNPAHDTHELATIFLPSLSDYSLAGVAGYFGYSYRFHRALADAEATKHVFLAILELASRLSVEDIAEIERLVSGTGMSLEMLLEDIKQLKAQTAFEANSGIGEMTAEAAQVFTKVPPLTPNHEKSALDTVELDSILKLDGVLSKAFDEYEFRTQQVDMMHAVVRAFNDDEHLLVEAGTGTGKSIAYLLPAITYAQSNNAHVVISTNTINLQEQLLEKDIPQLLGALGANIKAVQLKGRSNYLCRHRFNVLRNSQGLSNDDIRLIIRTLFWLKTTASGDKAGLNLGAKQDYGWSRVCAQAESCLFGNCTHLKKGLCFLQQARQAAESAHIIIINHALLISDVASGGNVLPQYAHIIIDEAHHLEEEATRQFGFKLTQRSTIDLLDQLSKDVGGQHYTGVLHLIKAGLAGSGLSSTARKKAVGLVEAVQAKVERTRARIDEFFGVFRDFMELHAQDQYNSVSRYARQVRITKDVKAQPAWYRVEAACENLILVFKEIEEGLNRVLPTFDQLPDNTDTDHEALAMEMASIIGLCAELSDKLKQSIFSVDTDYIHWATLAAKEAFISLEGAPLSVAGLLWDSIFSQKDTVVLTSATLSTEGAFDYIKERLGLEYVSELILDAPFDYKNAAMVYVPSDVPEPNQRGYQQALERAIIEVCETIRGRTLILFTSHAALQTTYAAIRPALEEESILVLGQGIDGSPKRLLEHFKAHLNTVLLGAASFWEGVDVVGDALVLLVLVRLPFNVPSDPVFAARSETFDDSFGQYALPQAILKFKQGFGRLIRSRTDKGAMVVLDKRIKSKRYGNSFLNSLPPVAVVSGLSKDLSRAVTKWLSIEK
jgi:DNA polymerase-3 subunit epsilon/ATP-dependent DNA helicase DinG